MAKAQIKKKAQIPEAPPIHPLGVALFGLALLTFTIILQTSALSVAVIAIHKDLSISMERATWIVNSMLLTMGSLIIPCGRLGDIFDYNRTLRLGGLIFFLCGLVAGFVTSDVFLILAIIGQGIGAALFLPAMISIGMHRIHYTKHGLIMGINMGAIGLGLTLGPIGVGTLLEYANWQWIFYLTAAMSAIALICYGLSIRGVVDRPKEGPLDIAGSVIFCFLAFSVLYLIQIWGKGEFFSINSLIWVCAVGITAAFFWLRECGHPNPLVQFSVFMNRVFISHLLIRGVAAAGIYATLFIWGYYLQHIFLYSPIQSALMLLPLTVSIVVFALSSGYCPLTAHWEWMRWGYFLYATGFLLLAGALFISHTLVWTFVPMVVMGLGFGVFLPTNALVALYPLNPNVRGVGASMLFMAVFVISAISIMIATIFVHQLGPHLLYSELAHSGISVTASHKALIQKMFQGAASMQQVEGAFSQGNAQISQIVQTSATRMVQYNFLFFSVISYAFYALSYVLTKSEQKRQEKEVRAKLAHR